MKSQNPQGNSTETFNRTLLPVLRTLDGKDRGLWKDS